MAKRINRGQPKETENNSTENGQQNGPASAFPSFQRDFIPRSFPAITNKKSLFYYIGVMRGQLDSGISLLSPAEKEEFNSIMPRASFEEFLNSIGSLCNNSNTGADDNGILQMLGMTIGKMSSSLGTIKSLGVKNIIAYFIDMSDWIMSRYSSHIDFSNQFNGSL
jgi:hypothetical protein